MTSSKKPSRTNFGRFFFRREKEQKGSPHLRSKVQSTKEGEPAAIENEAEWNKRRNLRRRRSRQSVGRQQWEYDEVGEEKEEEKISRRSIARLVKLHFSERCCVKERGRAKKAADRAFSRLVCHKRSSRWWSEQ